MHIRRFRYSKQRLFIVQRGRRQQGAGGGVQGGSQIPLSKASSGRKRLPDYPHPWLSHHTLTRFGSFLIHRAVFSPTKGFLNLRGSGVLSKSLASSTFTGKALIETISAVSFPEGPTPPAPGPPRPAPHLRPHSGATRLVPHPDPRRGLHRASHSGAASAHRRRRRGFPLVRHARAPAPTPGSCKAVSLLTLRSKPPRRAAGPSAEVGPRRSQPARSGEGEPSYSEARPQGWIRQVASPVVHSWQRRGGPRRLPPRKRK